MSAMFTAVSKLRTGYDQAQVEEFFSLARSVYEGSTHAEVTAATVREATFELVRGGYATATVDAALDRLEQAFVARTRADVIASQGQQAWMGQLADQARTLYPRLSRPARKRFAPPAKGERGYHPDDVDELCTRMVAYFDRGAALTSDDVRGATFRRKDGAGGYAEGPVDAFFSRAVEILLGVE